MKCVIAFSSETRINGDHILQDRHLDAQNDFIFWTAELFGKMAAELVSLNCDVLVGAGAAGPHLKKATKTIPIIFMFIPDAVGAELVESIARPGGNVTGLTNFSVQLSAKRLEYLKEIVPTVARVGLLINPNVKISSLYVQEATEAGIKLGVAAQSFEVRSLSDFELTASGIALMPIWRQEPSSTSPATSSPMRSSTSVGVT